MATFGPDFDPLLDSDRIQKQMERIREVMLLASEANKWLTLAEIEQVTRYPQASISAQLRHLRKDAFGSYIVRKRRREPAYRGIWEYLVKKRPRQLNFVWQSEEEEFF
jgi:hypothetical protein